MPTKETQQVVKVVNLNNMQDKFNARFIPEIARDFNKSISNTYTELIQTPLLIKGELNGIKFSLVEKTIPARNRNGKGDKSLCKPYFTVKGKGCFGSIEEFTFLQAYLISMLYYASGINATACMRSLALRFFRLNIESINIQFTTKLNWNDNTSITSIEGNSINKIYQRIEMLAGLSSSIKVWNETTIKVASKNTNKIKDYSNLV